VIDQQDRQHDQARPSLRLFTSQPTSVLAGFRQDLGVIQGWLERSAAWLEAGQKKLPEEV